MQHWIGRLLIRFLEVSIACAGEAGTRLWYSCGPDLRESANEISGALLGKDLEPSSLGDCLCSAGDIEFPVDVRGVPLYRRNRQIKGGSHFFVRQPLGEQCQHLYLPDAQGLDRVRLRIGRRCALLIQGEDCQQLSNEVVVNPQGSRTIKNPGELRTFIDKRLHDPPLGGK